MRKLTFRSGINGATYRTETHLYLDGEKTKVIFCKEELMDSIAFHGKVLADDIPIILLQELKEHYDITEEEETHYKYLISKLLGIEPESRNNNLNEILTILIEECGEVIQAASKVIRFGVHSDWTGTANNKHLFQELSDLQSMILLVQETMAGYSSADHIINIKNKLNKLKKFSNINHDLLDKCIGYFHE